MSAAISCASNNFCCLSASAASFFFFSSFSAFFASCFSSFALSNSFLFSRLASYASSKPALSPSFINDAVFLRAGAKNPNLVPSTVSAAEVKSFLGIAVNISIILAKATFKIFPSENFPVSSFIASTKENNLSVIAPNKVPIISETEKLLRNSAALFMPNLPKTHAAISLTKSKG